jgi:catechol 2,3-dioxygenase-like lactoylglutathione lyase family enzyme
MTLNHIHLGTKDLAKSIEFYSSLLGFKKKFDHPPGIFLENEAGFLLAIDPVDELPSFPSWYHIGFCPATEQEALALYEKCKVLGIETIRDLMHEPDQYVSFYIADPGQNKIEISWHNE